MCPLMGQMIGLNSLLMHEAIKCKVELNLRNFKLGQSIGVCILISY